MLFDTADLPSIDLFDAEFVADPYPTYEKVASSSWIAKCPFGGMILGQQEMRELLRDGRLLKAKDLLKMFGIVDGPYHRFFTTQMANTDGEDHSRLRRLIAPAFTPSKAEKARPVAREILNDILDRVAPRGSCDFVEAISSVYPIRLFCRLIGVPEEDVPRFASWARTMAIGVDMNADAVIDDLNDAITGIWRYVDELVERRSEATDGEGDLLHSLIAASEEPSRLTRDELVSLIILLLGAGYDTTANALAWGIVVLVERPDIWERMAEQPDIVPAVVEELLRFRTPAAITGRLVTEELEYRGVTFAADTYLMMANAAANHDPREYSDPETFDLGRNDGHIAFGFGGHSCVGAHLARAELQEALTMLPQRLRSPRLAGEAEFGSPLGVHTVERLPIKFEPRS